MFACYTGDFFGGRCLTSSFTHDAQMVAQSTDLTVKVHLRQDAMDEQVAVTVEGVHFDASWDRNKTEQVLRLDDAHIKPVVTQPMIVAMMKAPATLPTKWENPPESYGKDLVLALAKDIQLIRAVACELRTPMLHTGSLRHGCSRPLDMLLHLLLCSKSDLHATGYYLPKPTRNKRWSGTEQHERMVRIAARMLAVLRDRDVGNMEDAATVIASWKLPSAAGDLDLSAMPDPPMACREERPAREEDLTQTDKDEEDKKRRRVELFSARPRHAHTGSPP